jgi:hypothetical protein
VRRPPPLTRRRSPSTAADLPRCGFVSLCFFAKRLNLRHSSGLFGLARHRAARRPPSALTAGDAIRVVLHLRNFINAAGRRSAPAHRVLPSPSFGEIDYGEPKRGFFLARFFLWRELRKPDECTRCATLCTDMLHVSACTRGLFRHHGDSTSFSAKTVSHWADSSAFLGHKVTQECATCRIHRRPSIACPARYSMRLRLPGYRGSGKPRKGSLRDLRAKHKVDREAALSRILIGVSGAVPGRVSRRNTWKRFNQQELSSL